MLEATAANLKRKQVSRLWHNFANIVCKLLKDGGRACKPDSVMRKFAKSSRVFKLGITICGYLVYENIC